MVNEAHSVLHESHTSYNGGAKIKQLEIQMAAACNALGASGLPGMQIFASMSVSAEAIHPIHSRYLAEAEALEIPLRMQCLPIPSDAPRPYLLFRHPRTHKWEALHPPPPPNSFPHNCNRASQRRPPESLVCSEPNHIRLDHISSHFELSMSGQTNMLLIGISTLFCKQF